MVRILRNFTVGDRVNLYRNFVQLGTGQKRKVSFQICPVPKRKVFSMLVKTEDAVRRYAGRAAEDGHKNEALKHNARRHSIININM